MIIPSFGSRAEVIAGAIGSPYAYIIGSGTSGKSYVAKEYGTSKIYGCDTLIDNRNFFQIAVPKSGKYYIENYEDNSRRSGVIFVDDQIYYDCDVDATGINYATASPEDLLKFPTQLYGKVGDSRQVTTTQGTLNFIISDDFKKYEKEYYAHIVSDKAISVTFDAIDNYQYNDQFTTGGDDTSTIVYDHLDKNFTDQSSNKFGVVFNNLIDSSDPFYNLVANGNDIANTPRYNVSYTTNYIKSLKYDTDTVARKGELSIASKGNSGKTTVPSVKDSNVMVPFMTNKLVTIGGIDSDITGSVKITNEAKIIYSDGKVSGSDANHPYASGHTVFFLPDFYLKMIKITT